MCLANVCLLLAMFSFLASAQQTSWEDTLSQGRSQRSLGHFREAEVKFQSVLKEAERSPEALDTQAVALYDLATVKVDQGRIEEATRFFERAASILAKIRGEDDLLFRTVRLELAGVYFNANEFSIAEKLLRQILATPSGPSEAATLQRARALDFLACIYAWQKKRSAAEKLARESLAVMEKSQGAGGYSLAVANLHLGAILDAAGRPAEGLPYAERAAEIMKRLPDVTPFAQGQVAMSLASLYVRAGHKDEADPVSQGAVDVVQRFYGPDHPYTASMLLARAAVLRRLGRKQEAKAPQKEAERIAAEQGSRNRLGDTVPLSALLPVH